MRTGILGSVGALLAAAPLSLADPPPATPVPPAAIATDLPAAPLGGHLPPPGDATATPPPDTAQPTTPPAQQQPAAQPAASQACAQPPANPAWRDCHVGPHEQIWLGGGYRTGWIKDGPLAPALVTTGPVAGGGNVNSPGTAILFGAQDIDYGTFQGFDVRGGLWLNCRHTVGVEGGGFYMGRQSVSATFASDGAGNPFLARPIIEALTLNPVGVIVASPGVLAGAITVNTSSRLAGGEANIVHNIIHCPDRTVDSFMGFKYIDLDEDLTVTQVTRPLGGGSLAFNGGQLPAGVGLTLFDSFRTRNQFYGGQVGSRGEWRFGPAFVGFSSSVALGPNHQVLDISGATTSGTGVTQTGGLLAVGGGSEAITGPQGFVTNVPRGNIGRFTTNRFIYAPEGSIQVGAYVTSHVKVTAGYSYLYMSDVLRPGQQIDPAVNARFVPASPAFGSTSGQSRPMVTGRHDDFHVHALQFGMEVRY